MSFLRTMVADARPRSSAPAPDTRYQVTARLPTGALNQDFPQARQQPVEASDQKNHVDVSPSIAGEVSETNKADIAIAQKDSPVQVDIRDPGNEQLERIPENENGSISQPVAQNSPEITFVPVANDLSPEPSIAIPEPAMVLSGSQEVQSEADTVEPATSEPASYRENAASDAGGAETNTEVNVNAPDEPEPKPVKNVENLPHHDESVAAKIGGEPKPAEQIGSASQADSMPTQNTSEIEYQQAGKVSMASKPLPHASKNTLQENVTGLHAPESVREVEFLKVSPTSDTSEPVRGDNPVHEHTSRRSQSDEIVFNQGASHQISPERDKQNNLEKVSGRHDAANSNSKTEAEGFRREVKPAPEPTVASGELSQQQTNSTSQPTATKPGVAASLANPVAPKPAVAQSQTKGRDHIAAIPAKVLPAEATAWAVEHRKSKLPNATREQRQESPSVLIGQIDVIVEMPVKPAAKPTPAPLSGDLASRHYLRRL